MSRAEILQLVAAFMGAFASLIAGIEARLVKRFKDAGATSREHCLELPALAWLMRWRLARLQRAGAIVEADPGLYYLDTEAFRRFKGKRRARAIAILLLVAAAVTIGLLMS